MFKLANGSYLYFRGRYCSSYRGSCTVQDAYVYPFCQQQIHTGLDTLPGYWHSVDLQDLHEVCWVSSVSIYNFQVHCPGKENQLPQSSQNAVINTVIKSYAVLAIIYMNSEYIKYSKEIILAIITELDLDFEAWIGLLTSREVAKISSTPITITLPAIFHRSVLTKLCR